ncbi:uncharacterized protein IUM83_03735 [Phytophthora cinnamomi]|uniref:uncharacterized protein n=1 Tax=Phytophthora cinnamomi TaxID=4785 RepID=UPI0035593EFF|nr:hypothetical protein IUM83_03735 [Phytophthora cinnamomi]
MCPAVSPLPPAHVPAAAARRNQAQPESLFDDGSDVDAAEPAGSLPRTPSTGGDHQRLVLEELAAFPDVLERYLAARRAQSSENAGMEFEAQPRRRASSSGDDDDLHEFGPKSKRQCCTSDEVTEDDSPHHQFKLLFRPTPSQRQEKGTKINMQNFSSSVELPTVAAPESLAQIKAALESMKTYCDAFGSLSTCRVAQALQKVIQETAGLEFWEATDLKYLVYWIDTVLERYRSVVADDSRTGRNTRSQFHTTVTPSDPELQRFNQLVTAKKVQLLLHDAGRALHGSHDRSDSGWNGRSKYGHVSRGSRGAGVGWDQQHRQQQFASASTSKVSPFGAVPKLDGAIRLIHDLSFPVGDSVNDHTVQTSLPITQYESVVALARRIELLHLLYPNIRIQMLKGNVKGAFRHLCHHADDVVWMGGRVPALKAGVIDLSAPFGWTGSPAIYNVVGRAISTIVGRESPASMAPDVSDASPFFAYEWVDDHVLVEPDLGARCSIAEDTLRLAMLAVLGPLAINEAKFSSWGTQMRALGLDWDCTARTVCIPADKIAKALTRVEAAATSQRMSSVELRRLLGSLRHVASCLRAAKPFYQRLHTMAASVPRSKNVRAATHVTIRFSGSKTDQVGEATTRTLAKTTSPWLCPERAARALIRENKNAADVTPLCWVNGAVLLAKALEKIITKVATRCGKDSRKFGTHSLRCGGATALLQAGCEDSIIKLQGRWSSDCYQRYIHMEVTSREKLADMMATGSSGPKSVRQPQAAPLGG